MSHKVQITIDDELYSDIKAGAKRTGLSISSYVRLALLNVLPGKREKLLEQAIADVKANRLESLTLKEFNRQLDDGK
jgi:Arc/MetJ family transcription regulator